MTMCAWERKKERASGKKNEIAAVANAATSGMLFDAFYFPVALNLKKKEEPSRV